MANATFTPGDEKQDERLNPGQQDYDRRFNDIARQEERGTFDDIANNFDQTADDAEENANIDKLRSKEASSAPSSEWRNNVDESSKKSRGEKAKGWFKKAGPLLGTGGIFGIGGFVLIGLTSPSLLIVQLKETMVDKFNTQLSSLEARSTKLLTAKINNTTSGLCTSKVSIKCKYSTMSKKQVAKFKAAGIEVEGGEAIAGRIKPTKFKFGDVEVDAKNFASVMKSNTSFRSAVRTAYNPKYAGFVGEAWTKVASKFKINKQAPDLNAAEDPDAAKKKINDISKEGTEDTGSRTTLTADAEGCEGDNCISEDDAKRVNDGATELEDAGKNGTAASDVKAKLNGLGGSVAVSSIFKITGIVDNACQVYGAVSTLSYAAKAIRAAQLVRYAMIFFSVADSIKAGDSPKSEDVELLGNTLTATVADPNNAGVTAVGAATDSFGYKYAAYGDASASQSSTAIANRFMAGGGFVGEMSTAMATVMSFIPGGKSGAKATCGTLANPLVQGASVILGVASLFVPGANVARIASSAAAGIAVSVVISVLPSLLADIVAGTVTDNIAGEESGNAITSGAGALMSDSLAAENGNAPMSKEDAIAYNELQTQTSNEYIADEVASTSPFDATNSHTFLGSIVHSLLPLQSSSNPLTTITSFLASSVQNVIPSSSAVTTQQYADSLNVCSDMDMQDANIAADPFCNVIRGIPPKYLDRDPFDVVNRLISGGWLTEDGSRTQQYEEFVDTCITPSEPLGYANADTGYDGAAVEGCLIKDNGSSIIDPSSNNVDLYLNYLDQRVQLGLDGDDEDGASTSSVADVNIDEANLFVDSTTVACAAGTNDAGVSVGYSSGSPINIRLCEMPNTTLVGKGTPGLVNSRASGAAYAMFEKMRTDIGVDKITLNDSYRTMAEQQDAKAQYGGQAATPGYSNHQMGYAFDINMGSANNGNGTGYSMNVNTSYPGSAPWEWLKTNASNYHFSQLPSEGWHWSITGG